MSNIPAPTRPAPSPSTTALPCEREPQFEHRIPRRTPNVVQVRPQRRKGQLQADWSTYMTCETPDDAQRILWLLYNRVTHVLP